MTTEDVRLSAAEAGLVYVDDRRPGIRRERIAEGFAYRHPNGREVRDSATLDRIRSLAIPPAYERVWICPLPEGHLQGTGYDARGRKQYRYHARFRSTRDESKFLRMLVFGRALPEIRQRIQADLARRDLSREKVLAAVVDLLERSLIRIGNAEYARTNESFGLTTLRNEQAEVQGAKIQLRFRGKSRIDHDVQIRDRRLANLIRKLQDLPGQELFGYLAEDGRVRDVTSQDVNSYLREISGQDFTAKDFRTWAATLMAIETLSSQAAGESMKTQRAAVSACIKQVARQLGNTPAVCRKSYIHPSVLEAFAAGRLAGIQDAREALVKLLAPPDDGAAV